jgi:hypothetical protein
MTTTSKWGTYMSAAKDGGRQVIDVASRCRLKKW